MSGMWGWSLWGDGGGHGCGPPAGCDLSCFVSPKELLSHRNKCLHDLDKMSIFRHQSCECASYAVGRLRP
jgi:hypothetical protein